MIRINLLGTPKPKMRGPRLTMALPSTKMIGLLLLAIAGLGLYFMYWRANKQHEKNQEDLRAAAKEQAALANVKAIFAQKQKEYDLLKRKTEVIEKLRASQTGEPVHLLNTVAETVNSTEAVWLSRMSDEGSAISMEGMALSTTAVANLISNLKKTGKFKNIELKETSQDERLKEYQAFTFTLTCQRS